MRRLVALALLATTGVSSVAPQVSAVEAPYAIRLLGSYDGYLSQSAFEGRRIVTDNGDGFTTYRRAKTEPMVRRVRRYLCRAGGRSISVWRGFVIQSVSDGTTELSETCNNTDDSINKQGIRIIDARDPRHPKQVKFLETPCGSADHSFLPVGRVIFIYDIHELPLCTEDRTSPEPLYLHVFRFDPRHPRRAQLAAQPNSEGMEACDRTSVHVERKLLACTALNRVALFSLEDPANPRFIASESFDEPGVVGQWLESTFSWDGELLVVQGYCKLLVLDVTEPADLVERSRISSPRGSCPSGFVRAQSLNFVPMRARHRRVGVMPWGEDGFSVFDLTDPSNPTELSHYGDHRVQYAYWYNGRVYAGARSGRKEKILVLKVRGLNRRAAYFYNRMLPHTQLEDFR